MDTFFSGIPEYTRSPLTDTKPVVEGLREDVVLGRIIEYNVDIIQTANASHVTTYILTPNRTVSGQLGILTVPTWLPYNSECDNLVSSITFQGVSG